MAQSDMWRSTLDPERIMRVTVTHWQEQQSWLREEQLTVEEPLEVRLNGQSLAVIMRTPGHDNELALGFLLSEGIIQPTDKVLKIEVMLDADGLPLPNVLNVMLCQDEQPMQFDLSSSSSAICAPAAKPLTAFERHFAVSSSCGLCGKNSIADLMLTTPPLEFDMLHIPVTTFYKLAERLRGEQAVFGHTGGLHAAGLFDLAGTLLLLREDVGRHNAVDKLIGHALFHNAFPYRERLLLVSGRTSFEIVQKALIARIPCLVAISAPSSLAVDLAEKGGITLIGFLRGTAMNVYTHAERIISA